MLCVCCVKGHKKDLFLKATSFTQFMLDSAPFVLLLLLCDGRDVKQSKTVCVWFTQASLCLSYFGGVAVCVWECLGLCLCSVRFSYPPEFQSGLPSLGPCGVQRGRRPTPSYITVLLHRLTGALGSCEALGLDLIKCFCSVLNSHLLGDSHVICQQHGFDQNLRIYVSPRKWSLF